MGACFTRLSAEMVSPPLAYNGDPFSPERSVPRNLMPQTRSTPPATSSGAHHTSMQASMDARRIFSRPRMLTHRTALSIPDYSEREGRGSMVGRGRQTSAVSPHGTRWSNEKIPAVTGDMREYIKSPYRSGEANENGDSKCFDYGSDYGHEAPILRTETGTTIPGLSYDQAGRPVWRDPHRVSGHLG